MTDREAPPSAVDADSISSALALRQRAEARFTGQGAQPFAGAAPLSPDATQQILHELHVHQIELEMQNEELRRAQEELDASLARYSDLYDFAPVGYCTLSAEGRIRHANLTAASLLGAMRGTLANQPLSWFILVEDQEIFRHMCQRLVASGEAQSCELRMLRNDCTPFWAHLTASGTHDADGAPLLRLALSDLTPRKRAEEALKESEEFKQAILDSMSAQIAVLNNDGVIVAVNAAWRRFTQENSRDFGICGNLGKHENIGSLGEAARHADIGADYLALFRARIGDARASSRDALHNVAVAQTAGATPIAEIIAAAGEGISAVLEGHRPHFSFDYPCRIAQRWFSMCVTPLAIRGRGAVIAHHDISERKWAEQELERDRETLVREVHHRIKNNLQGVAGLLQRELGRFCDQNPRLEAAISQVNAIAVVHGLQASDADESIRLCDSVRNICQAVSDLAQRPVLFQIEDDQTIFRPVQIEKKEAVSVALVLNELVLNALKHSPPDSAAPVVSLQSNGTLAHVTIRNAVYRLPAFDIESGKGLGTGLRLVRSLLPEDGTRLTYELDSRCFLQATLILTAPVLTAAPLRNCTERNA